jgi:D-aminoacyl-tRNA deacylase
MKDEVAIVCSTLDQASLNIANRLQELARWEDHGDYKSCRNYRLVIHGHEQITLIGLEDRLVQLGIRPKLVVFACRHKAKEAIPWLGGHFTGKIDAVADGAERQLSVPSPFALRSFLHHISRQAPAGFQISVEATHHGPTDLNIPCFFAEIGSCERQWIDPSAGQAVAKSILSLEMGELPVFLGLGGGHYVPRQTSLMLETEIAFGHMFSSYQVEALDPEILEEARKKSGAAYAYLDRKSLRSENKKRISIMLDEIDLPQIRGNEIRTRFPTHLKRLLDLNARK